MKKIKHKLNKKKKIVFPPLTLKELVYRCNAEGIEISFGFRERT